MRIISSVPTLNFYSSTGSSLVKCCVAYCQIPRFQVRILVRVPNQLCLEESRVVSGGASHELEVPSTLCNWFKAWYNHSLFIYISQQTTSLSFLTYKHTKLRLALVQLLRIVEYEFSSCTVRFQGSRFESLSGC